MFSHEDIKLPVQVTLGCGRLHAVGWFGEADTPKSDAAVCAPRDEVIACRREGECSYAFFVAGEVGPMLLSLHIIKKHIWSNGNREGLVSTRNSQEVRRRRAAPQFR